MANNSLLLGLLVVFLFSFCTAQSAQDRTENLYNDFVKHYGLVKVSEAEGLSCLAHFNCTSCTQFVDCVWVSSSSSAGVVATTTTDGKKIIDYQNVNFCWSGTVGGGTNLNIKKQTEALVNTEIVAKIGFGDYSWRQCGIKGGALLILVSLSPVLCCFFCCLACCCIFLCCAGKRNNNGYKGM
ncbi:hypothetical protein AKO1_006847 [Acrasis kona]|uniref:Uncharacterized protein n=1 Tax=Acrasis kona TaxID=1008807 RepID=A0AAW2YTQ1_9EUKA